jgi:hypothetical protein
VNAHRSSPKSHASGTPRHRAQPQSFPSDNGSKNRPVLHRTRDLCPLGSARQIGPCIKPQGCARASSGHLRGVSIKKTLSAVTQAARKLNVSVGGGSAGQGRVVSGVGVQGVMNHDCFFSRREKAGVHGGMLKRRPIPCYRVLQIMRRCRDMHFQLVGDILGTVAVI